ncbi:MAG: ribonuclease III family protein [Bilophila wadsworthia]
MTLDVLQDRIGYRFKDESLLVLAVTHSSWANEHSAGNAHNERLEFLGDAVLEIAVSAQLFARFPDAREGELTRLRSSLVNEATLAVIARKLHLDDCLRLAVAGRIRRASARFLLSDDGSISAAYSWMGVEKARGRGAAAPQISI